MRKDNRKLQDLEMDKSKMVLTTYRVIAESRSCRQFLVGVERRGRSWGRRGVERDM